MNEHAHDRFALDVPKLTAYLRQALGHEVQIRRLRRLSEAADSENDPPKEYGYGKPIRIDYQLHGQERSAVFHTMRPGPFGHEDVTDRAAIQLWQHHAFNKLPRHVRSLDVGAWDEQGRLMSLGCTGEFFLLTEYVPGRPYADDLTELRDLDEPRDNDLDRADALCDWLLEIHREKGTQASLYTRRIRELVGHGECIMGLIDSYPDDHPSVPAHLLEQIEKQAVAARWRIKHRAHRLAQVHGDLHPWNILFREGTDFSALDRSRGLWGEPADDVTSLTLNYVFQSLLGRGRYDRPMRALFERFWSRYLKGSVDEELLQVAGPFVAFRALVMASPVWYPHIDDAVRMQLLNLVQAALGEPAFEPTRIGEYLEGRA